jgi:Fe-S oxidoreductase
LNKVLTLKTASQEREKALCCGGSLGNFEIQNSQRTQIRDKALDVLMESKPDMLVTSCPLCKRTFAKGNNIDVKDIAEVVKDALVTQPSLNRQNKI